MTDIKKRIIKKLESKRRDLINNINDIKYRVIPICLSEGMEEEVKEWESDLLILQGKLDKIESIMLNKFMYWED